MRFAKYLPHMLVGLAATALIAAAANWIWPAQTWLIWTVAYMVMALVILKDVVRAVRDTPNE